MTIITHSLFTEIGGASLTGGGKHALSVELDGGTGTGGQHGLRSVIVLPRDTFNIGEQPNANGGLPSDGGTPWTVGDIAGLGTVHYGVTGGRSYLSLISAPATVGYVLRAYPSTATQVTFQQYMEDTYAGGYSLAFVNCSLAAGVLTGYAFKVDGTKTSHLLRITNGVATNIADFYNGPNWINKSASIDLRYNSTTKTLTASINGTVVMVFTDPTPLANGTMGGFGGTTGQFDNINLVQPAVEDFYGPTANAPLAGRTFPGTPYIWQNLQATPVFTLGLGAAPARQAFTGFNSSRLFFDNSRTTYRIEGSFGGDGYGLIWRAIDINNYWYVAYNYPNAFAQIIKVVAGVGTVVATVVIAPIQAVEVTPTTITYYPGNGTPVVITDSALGSATGVGIYGGLPAGGTYGFCDHFTISPFTPSPLFADNFDRADGALGITSTGAKTWLFAADGATPITWAVATNRAQPPTNPFSAMAYFDLGQHFGYVEANLGPVNNFAGPGVVICSDGTVQASGFPNGVWAFIGSGGLNVGYGYGAGTFGYFVSSISLPPSPVVRLVASAAGLECFINGATIGTVYAIPSQLLANTKCGIMKAGTGQPVLDNFMAQAE